MAALRSFKIICGPLQLLLLLLLQDLVEPSQLQIRGPQSRIKAGSRASFQCSASESSEDIQVKWIKNGKTIQPNQTKISSTENKGKKLYHVTSSVAILLGQGDVKSQLTCQIQHNSSQKSQGNFELGDVLRVPPKIRLETIPLSSIQLNARVMVTCNAEGFYPGDAKLELYAKDAPSRKGMVGQRISNPDGTYSLKSYLEVKATEDKNSSVFLCQVPHGSQDPLTEVTNLFIMRPLKTSENSQEQSIVVLCIALFLSRVAILFFIFCLFLTKVFGRKRTKTRSRTSQEVRQSGTSS
ncbi:tyrosine-protein phosphatase non-receptor type substrate 1-like [Ahaetulla prasina]|uniref:tyrosine-protein phosphatase non-receptor type substrate 1-like n=1 Tax=Ahaetulla prasina TaxID=499056 RepID=UPI0026473616|nr:tyrosine-protein phosphatase non-receptor type substrate 1-like [Ahaetulla prasina]